MTTICSRAQAAEGPQAEPHTYRTHTFIFSWSSTSAAYGTRIRRIRTNDGVAEKWPLMAAIWRPAFSRPAGQLIHAAGLQSASKQFDIGDPFYDQLTAVKLGYPLTSITWPYRGLKLKLVEILFFFLTWPLTRLWTFIGSWAQVFS